MGPALVLLASGSGGSILLFVGLAMGLALGLALAAASTVGRGARSTPPPPDPQAAISTLAGEVDVIRAGLPAGDYRSWSEHGPV
jgi:hypothetical protein